MLRDCRAQGLERAARGAFAPHPSHRALSCVLTVPRCPRPGTVLLRHPASCLDNPSDDIGTALCGESQLWHPD